MTPSERDELIGALADAEHLLSLLLGYVKLPPVARERAANHLRGLRTSLAVLAPPSGPLARKIAQHAPEEGK